MLTKRKRSRWLRFVVVILGVLGIWLLALAVEIYTYSFVSDPSSADVAIVLGAAAWDEQPSPVFEERIKHAIELYQAGRVKYLIFTGGIGTDEVVAESIVASRYAIGHGVPATRIFCETVSKFTHDNLRGAKAIVELQQFRSVLIVSDPLHMRRAMTMAADLGLDAHSSPTPTSRYVSAGSQLEFLWGEVRYYATYLVRRVFVTIDADYSAVQPCR